MRWLVVLALAACGGDAAEPLFGEDYAATYMQVRSCRSSSDHDLNKIRILADPAALEAYTMRAMPFPVGATVLKEEYEFSDGNCFGTLVHWTVMKKTDATTWTFQRVGPERDVESENEARCVNCHKQCGQPPDGFDGTCAMP
jgi:hypothetical protein